jgi:4-hydroxy-2-oxoglutarate aldolase
MNEARALQGQLTPLAKAVTTTYGIGGLKIAMDLTGYFGGDPRSPLKRPDSKAESELKDLLDQINSNPLLS